MGNEQNKQNENKDAKLTADIKNIGNTGKADATNNPVSAVVNKGNAGKDSFGTSSGQGVQSMPNKQINEKDSGASPHLASQVDNVLHGDISAAKEILSQAKESTGKVAGEALGQIKEKAATKIDEQKANLAQGLGSVAQTIRQVGEGLKDATGEKSSVASVTAQYSDSLAKQVEQFSNYLEKNNVSELLREVERFARRNPAYFIGGAFALGLLGARFLKSTNPNEALIPYRGGNSPTRQNKVSGSQPSVGDRGRDSGGTGSNQGVRPL